MIVQFCVTNYRSICDSQCISFVASDEKNLVKENCITTHNADVPRVVSSAAIWGANASGKSNLIFALTSMKNLILQSSNVAINTLANEYTPFKLGNTFEPLQPTKFEITLLLQGTLYQYSFSYNNDRICEEKLEVNDEIWFERKDNEWNFASSNFKGQRDSWKEMTRPDALYLTTAVQFNSEQLKLIFDWFAQKLVIVQHVEQFIDPIAQKIEDVGYKEKILKLLHAGDIHISDIKTVEREALKFELGKYPEPTKIFDIEFSHRTEDGKDVWFDRRYESLGTQRLLCYGGLLIDVLEEGKFFVVDEFDSNLHPLLARFLIESEFHNPDNNTKNAQFLITTHNTDLLASDLLSPNLFRKDQVWFVAKNEKQSSEFYSLAEFEDNTDTIQPKLDKEYLKDIYGAVPFLRK